MQQPARRGPAFRGEASGRRAQTIRTSLVHTAADVRFGVRQRLGRLWCQQRTFAIPAKPGSGCPRVLLPGRIRSNLHEQMRSRSIVCADDESRHAIPVGTTSARPTSRRSRAAVFVRYIFPVILRSRCAPRSPTKRQPGPALGRVPGDNRHS